MQKGFTIIELTAVILILAIIFMVTYPNITGMTKKNKDEQYKNLVKDLCLAGKSYIYLNQDKYFTPEAETIIIEVSDLIKNGTVSANLKNPITKKEIKNDKLEYYIMQDNELECNYIEEE